MLAVLDCRVDDVPAAAEFWGGVMGLAVTPLMDGTMLQLELPGSSARVLVYGKDDHRPAGFTVLNLGYGSAIAVVIFLLAIVFIISYLVRATKEED